jgi:multidrug efflux pump subunit AcrA (membrane-fusion protein)
MDNKVAHFRLAITRFLNSLHHTNRDEAGYRKEKESEMSTKMILLFLVTGLLCAACSNSTVQTVELTPTPLDSASQAITAEGRLEPVNFADVAYNASGVISDLLVKEGDQVKKGDVLVRLGDESDKAYTTAQLELVTAQQEYDDLLNSSGTEAAQAVIDLKQAKEDYDDAVNYLGYLQKSKKVPQTEARRFLVQTWKGYEYRYKTKNLKGPAPEDWIIEAQNDLALKKAKLDEAQHTYDKLKDGVDTEKLALLEARLNSAKAGIASLIVLAPFDGTVADLNARVRESVSQNSIAATVADFSNWLVKTTDLTELEVMNIRQGQPVSVVLDAIPDVTLNGVVDAISRTYTEKQGDVVYEVTIKLTDVHPSMLWGMTAVVTFLVPQD